MPVSSHINNYFTTLSHQCNTPVFIAEIGVNHNGDLELAKKLVDAAKSTGAHFVKFQSFSADTVACRSALSAPHADEALGVDGTFYELLDKLSITHAEQKELLQYCESVGVSFISTPFSFEDIDFLVELDVPFLKIGSTDTTHTEFLNYAAKTGKPLLLSTGMTDMAQVNHAVETIITAGNHNLALLHCVSLYPPELNEINLSAISTLKQRFPDIPIGFSDHTIGSWASLAATALGATIIEKHFTLDKTMAGPDQAVSADPKEMNIIVEEGTNIYRALGDGVKKASSREQAMETPFRRSIVSRKALSKGSVITREMIDFKRPAKGLSPDDLEITLGKVATEDIPADTPIEAHMLNLTADDLAQLTKKPVES